MALILNIETATDVCSAALADNGETFALKESKEEKSHSSLLSVFIEEIMTGSNISVQGLDAIAISKGPGSYTGLRIGVSTAKGLCYGADVPLISVSTLQAMASGIISSNRINELETGSLKDTLVCPMIDARRMEVYTAIYDSSCKIVEHAQAKIIDRTTFANYLSKKRMIFFGTGSEKCRHLLKNKNALFIDSFDTSARYMAPLSEDAYNKGKYENTAYFEPYYLKDFIATVPKNRLKIK